MSDDIKLFGVLAGVAADTICGDCGHPAIDHSPCCGACTVCGNKICPEFFPETP